MMRSLLLALSLAWLTTASAGTAAPADAVPIDPIEGILTAFKSHSIVALGDGVFHGEENNHEFRLSLIRDPRFAAAVDDLVLEAYNSKYQAIVDRYVAGRNVAMEELEKAWQDSTQIGPGVDAPMREEILTAVREVNATRPKRSRIRVLLADPRWTGPACAVRKMWTATWISERASPPS